MRSAASPDRLPCLDCLVVDDEALVRLSMEQMIRAAGHRATTAADGAAAVALLSERRFDVVVSDIRLPKVDGFALVAHIRRVAPTTQVLLMTAYASVPDAVQALRQGACDYLIKPIDGPELAKHLHRIAERLALRSSLQKARDEDISRRPAAATIIGNSPQMQRVLDLVDLVADTESPVLITGESGTGKELVARALQAASRRGAKAFLSINCAGFPETLLEAELFGHARGAYPGAVKRRDGRFKAADGGTLLLDEIGEMPLSAQSKLLRVIEEKVVQPLGSDEAVPADVRILSATHRKLPDLIKDGRFREDLYYRLKVVEICLPPLREHRSDLPLLFAHFARKVTAPGREPASITPRAWAAIEHYEFPGNIRELAHAIEQASVMARGEEIDLEHLPVELVGSARGPLAEESKVRTLASATDQFEKEYLLRVLAVAKGKRLRCAELLGISRRSLWLKLRKHGISRTDSKK